MATKSLFVTPYNNKAIKVKKCFTQPSLTEQVYKDECDIGMIIENYVKKGQLPTDKLMSYIDCTTVKDYQDAMYTIADCKSAFYSLPATERDKFKTVDKYLEFISDPKNLKESYERGLINPDTIDLKDVYPERYVVDTTPPNVVNTETAGSSEGSPVE